MGVTSLLELSTNPLEDKKPSEKMKYFCKECGGVAYAKDFDEIMIKLKLCNHCRYTDMGNEEHPIKRREKDVWTKEFKEKVLGNRNGNRIRKNNRKIK